MLSLERFAEIRAAIERGDDRDVVLRGQGIDRTAWIELQRHWLGELANEIESGSDALATRYCRAFDAVGRPVAAPEPPPAEPLPVNVPIDSAAHAPSYLKPVAETPAVAPRAPAKHSTVAMPVFVEPAGPVVPFREGAAAQLPAPAISPPGAGPRLPTGTALTLDIPRGPATPFRAEPAASEPSDPSAPAAPGRVGSGTAWAPSAPSSPATPFQAPAPEALGFNLIRYAELVAARDEGGADMAEVLARFEIDAAAHAQIEAYWRRKFSENGLLSLQFTPHLAQAQRALAGRRTPHAATPVGSGTTLALEVPRAALPQASPSGPLPELSVDQYAWLVATLRRTAPADLPAALARVRLTPETRRELEDRWSKSMAADPALQQRFLAALAQHLKGGGG